MNESVFFLRHGKPNIGFDSYADLPFSILCDLGKGLLNPGIDTEKTRAQIQTLRSENLFSQKSISLFASPILRAQETAQLISTNLPVRGDVQTCLNLEEVHFDLSSLYQPGENGIDMKVVNQKVLEAMGEGKYAESMESIFRRAELLFQTLKQTDGPILCISHDFFMKGIELFIRHKGDTAQISSNELFSTQANQFCRGFETTKDLSFFNTIS